MGLGMVTAKPRSFRITRTSATGRDGRPDGPAGSIDRGGEPVVRAHRLLSWGAGRGVRPDGAPTRPRVVDVEHDAEEVLGLTSAVEEERSGSTQLKLGHQSRMP